MQKETGGALSAGDSTTDIEKTSSLNFNREQVVEEEQAPQYERSINNWQWALVCVGLFLGAMLYGRSLSCPSTIPQTKKFLGLDTTIAADVQGPILKSLGEIEKLAWVGIGFPMGSVAVILLIGWCYALFEIKYLMIASVTMFEIGSAICGAAPNMNAIICGRVIAGMGGAGMYMG